jgi:hypothetical protein
MNHLLLQRFVDRRLSVAELQRLAQEAESHPEHWRQLASAVIEEQLWQRTLTSDRLLVFADQVVEESQAVPAGEAGLPANDHLARSNTADRDPPISSSAQSGAARDFWRGPRMGWWQFVVVASCLMALPMVYWAGSRAHRGFEAPNPISQLSRSEAGVSAEDRLRVVDEVRPATMPLVHNADRQIPKIDAPFSLQFTNNQRVQSTPLLTETTAREIGYHPVASDFPQDLQNRLRRDGYQLRSQIYFLQGNTADGRQIIVPIESVGVTVFGQ